MNQTQCLIWQGRKVRNETLHQTTALAWTNTKERDLHCLDPHSSPVNPLKPVNLMNPMNPVDLLKPVNLMNHVNPVDPVSPMN